VAANQRIKFFFTAFIYKQEAGELLCLVKGYGLQNHGSIFDRSKKVLSSPKGPDRLWGPPILLFNG